jgi:hypothetical protein
MLVKKLPIGDAQISNRSKESDLAIRRNSLPTVVGRSRVVCGTRKNMSKELNGICVYAQKQLYSGGMCYYTKAQLHVSGIKVGHLQVVHENLSIVYTNVSGVGEVYRT